MTTDDCIICFSKSIKTTRQKNDILLEGPGFVFFTLAPTTNRRFTVWSLVYIILLVVALELVFINMMEIVDFWLSKVYSSISSNLNVHHIIIELFEHLKECLDQPVQLIFLLPLRLLNHLITTLQRTDMLLSILHFHFVFLCLFWFAEDAVKDSSLAIKPSRVNFGVLVGPLNNGVVLLLVLRKEDLIWIKVILHNIFGLF